MLMIIKISKFVWNDGILIIGILIVYNALKIIQIYRATLFLKCLIRICQITSVESIGIRYIRRPYTRHDFQSNSRLPRSSVAVYRTFPWPFHSPFLKIETRREIAPPNIRYPRLPAWAGRRAHTWNFRCVIRYHKWSGERKSESCALGTLCNFSLDNVI